MSQYQRLFLIAGSAMHHSAAMQRAVALAETTGAALHVVVLIQSLDIMGLLSRSEQMRKDYLQEHRQWLEDEGGLLRAKGLKVSTDVVLARHPLQEVMQCVAEMQPDLVIKDVQHESALKRVFITPLDWQLLRECPVPVHLVSEVRCPLPKVVVAAVDLSRLEEQITGLNERIIQAANAMALQCDAELHLLHAADLSQMHIADVGAGSVTVPGFAADLRRSQHHAFLELAGRYGVPPERQQFIEGQPAKAIANFAAHSRADVIVMGSVHRTGLDKLVGSTTEHVLYQVPCNVLAIK